jgi:hypothetical protein
VKQTVPLLGVRHLNFPFSDDENIFFTSNTQNTSIARKGKFRNKKSIEFYFNALRGNWKMPPDIRIFRKAICLIYIRKGEKSSGTA